MESGFDLSNLNPFIRFAHTLIYAKRTGTIATRKYTLLENYNHYQNKAPFTNESY